MTRTASPTIRSTSCGWAAIRSTAAGWPRSRRSRASSTRPPRGPPSSDPSATESDHQGLSLDRSRRLGHPGAGGAAWGVADGPVSLDLRRLVTVASHAGTCRQVTIWSRFSRTWYPARWMRRLSRRARAGRPRVLGPRWAADRSESPNRRTTRFARPGCHGKGAKARDLRPTSMPRRATCRPECSPSRPEGLRSSCYSPWISRSAAILRIGRNESWQQARTCFGMCWAGVWEIKDMDR